jgi:hypothetical protein
MPCHTQPKNRSESGNNEYPRDCNPVFNGDLLQQQYTQINGGEKKRQKAVVLVRKL